MRCAICNNPLSNEEVVWNPSLGKNCDGSFEPCLQCLREIMDAAYSGDFAIHDDEEIAVEVGDEFGDGIVETLDTEVSLSDYQGGDASDIPGRDDYDYT